MHVSIKEQVFTKDFSGSEDAPWDFDLIGLEWGLGIGILKKNLSHWYLKIYDLNIQPGLKITHTGESWFLYILHCIFPASALPPPTILDRIFIMDFVFLSLYYLKSLFKNSGAFPSMIRPTHPCLMSLSHQICKRFGSMDVLGLCLCVSCEDDQDATYKWPKWRGFLQDSK